MNRTTMLSRGRLGAAFSGTTRTGATALLGAAMLAATGCSGGGSSSETIVGLSVAEQMSVVTTDDGGSPATSNSIAPRASADTSAFPTDCDYNNDPSHGHVYDPSMETLQVVNEILCMLSQTSYTQMVNLENYKAQVDEEKCQQGGDQSSSGSEQGQSSGAGAGAPKIWIVNSHRASNGTDQIVEFWVPQGGGDDGVPGVIHAKMVVSEGASDANPFGVFTLNFVGVPQGGTEDNPEMFGTLKTLDVADGFIGFSFFEQEGDINQPQLPNHHAGMTQANVNMFADQTQGVAYIKKQEHSNFPPGGDTGIIEESYRIAFNTTNVLRAKNLDPSTCLSRTDFDTRVWRYNLYNATGENAGQRVELNSGFGFRTEGGEYGWMGYYGMWISNDVTINNGDTVTRDVFGQSNAPTYTVVKAPGKLIKNTRHTLDLTELSGETFNWWDFGTPGMPPVGPPTQYRIEYQAPLWNKTGLWNDSSHMFTDISPPQPIDMATHQYLGMWSESLGGSVSYVNGDMFITYYAQEFVNGSSDVFAPGDTAVELYGYFNCLDSGITSAQGNNGNVYLDPAPDVSMPYHYVFDKNTLTLYYDTDGSGMNLIAAGLGAGQVVTNGPFTWGMRSGPMVTSTANLMTPYEVWTQEVFYTYETGSNPWNQYAALLDANGLFVTFDHPLQFTYTHTTADDINGDSTYNNKKYLLSYNGSGNLFGIPFDGFDLDGNGSIDRWYPLFGIKDGTLMGPNGTEFVIKAIEKEQTLSAAVGGCVGLDISTVDQLPLPDASDFTPPGIGDEPAISDPPRVIEGELQGG